jgi:hypothetical protein
MAVKGLTCLLVVLLAFQGSENLFSQTDPLNEDFLAAHSNYTQNMLIEAQTLLQKIVVETANKKEHRELRGRSLLLLGAVYEKLEKKKEAVTCYCEAKDILGSGVTYEGLELDDLLFYDEPCPENAGVKAVAAVKKHRGGGKFLLTLLGLAALAGIGYLVYTQVIKKADSDDDGDGDSNGRINYETQYRALTCWSGAAHSSSATAPTFNSNWNPNPTSGNGYDNTSTCTISGTSITSWSVKLMVTACNNLTRRDQVWINGNLVLDESKKYANTCSTGNVSEFCRSPGTVVGAGNYQEYPIHSGSGATSFTIRHKITFTRASGQVTSIVNSETNTDQL